MGIPGEYENPKLWQGLERICSAATAVGKFVGIGGFEPRLDLLKQLREKYPCVAFVMAGRDLGLMQQGMAAMCKRLEGL